MKPRLIVHIGTQKTGTASIQQAMVSIRARMRRDAGILFASTERGALHTKHSSVSRAAGSGDTEADVEYGALMEQFSRSGASGLFITDEGLSTGQARMANFFKRFKADFQIEVVVYLRRQDIFMEAMHNQLMRGKSGLGVPPVADLWKEPYMSRRLDYDQWLQHWAKVADQMCVLDFKKEIARVGLIPSFLEAIGFGALSGVRNPMSSQTADVRLLHLMGMLATGSDKAQVRLMFDGLRRAARTVAESGAFPLIKTSLGRLERERLLAAFRESNERLASNFGITFDDDRPEEGNDPITSAPGDYVLAVLGDLMVTDALRAQQCAQTYLSARGVAPGAANSGLRAKAA